MSAAETVKLTIDGVAVEVPKGTGLVEAALTSGIEIPVFCYEPRLENVPVPGTGTKRSRKRAA